MSFPLTSEKWWILEWYFPSHEFHSGIPYTKTFYWKPTHKDILLDFKAVSLGWLNACLSRETNLLSLLHIPFQNRWIRGKSRIPMPEFNCNKDPTITRYFRRNRILWLNSRHFNHPNKSHTQCIQKMFNFTSWVLTIQTNGAISLPAWILSDALVHPVIMLLYVGNG